MTSTGTDNAPKQRTVSVWRNRNFLLLWGSQTVNETGARISGVAIPLLATSQLGASTFEVSAITALTWLPFLVFSLPAGVVVDRLPRRRLMIFCDLARMVLIASLPIGALFGAATLTQVYVVVTATGILTVFFNVAFRTQLPGIVEDTQLVEGNGHLSMGQSVAKLVGPAAGGVFAGAIGALRAVLANGAAFLVSACLLGLIRTPEQRPTATGSATRPTFTAAVREGLGFVVRHPVLRPLLACSSAVNFFFMAMTGLQVVYLVDDLEASPSMVGVVFSLGMAGGALAGVFAGRIARRIGTARITWVSLLAAGPLCLPIPFARPGWGISLFAIGLTVISISQVLYNTAETSYRQQVCPPELLARANASVLWVAFGVIPFGALFGGAVASAFGIRTALTVCVLGMWASPLFLVFSPLRTIRNIPIENPGK
ncbi:MFS transporter [Streptomyces sp. NPDC088719]|uniref:MFS transporter n=1 Tax=Streptomyces sp. NPDC088719 TaxID=3365872 RepID=UPI003825AADD